MVRKFEVIVADRKLRLNPGVNSEAALTNAAKKANEVIARMVGGRDGKRNQVQTTHLVQALFTVCLSYENLKGDTRTVIEETSGELETVRHELEQLIIDSGGFA